jgi:ABA sandwich protein
MTNDEILNMPAGREMDALIAEKVMGHEVKRDVVMWREGNASLEPYSEGFTVLAHYSTDIGAAWEVVEKIQTGELRLHEHKLLRTYYLAEFHEPGGSTFMVRAETAPLAICRAALLFYVSIKT